MDERLIFKKAQKRVSAPCASIRTRTAMNLIILSFVIIASFWLAQMLLFSLTAPSLDAYQISRIGDDIRSAYSPYPSPAFHDHLKSQSSSHGLNITVFTADLDYENSHVVNTYVIYSVSPFTGQVYSYGSPLDWNDTQFDTFFQNYIFSGQSSFTYTLDSPSALVYGGVFLDAKFDVEIFVYLESYRSSSNFELISTLVVLSVASFLCIIVAIFLAILYSRQFSHPIVEFSRAAELLAKGKYDSVRFRPKRIAEFDSLAASLSNAATQLKETDRFRREFLANITHDLRTPITMMLGYAEMIRDISGDNKQKRTAHAQIIIDEAQRLSLLVEDILLMSKLEAGTLILNPSEFDISKLAATVASRFNIKTIKDGVTINLELGKELMMTADVLRIEQVLYNLIANAINYAGTDKVTSGKTTNTASPAAQVKASETGTDKSTTTDTTALQAKASETGTDKSTNTASPAAQVKASETGTDKSTTTDTTALQVKASETGSEKVVTVRTSLSGAGKVRVEIADNGSGIAAEELPLIWDRYYRINQNTRKIIGSGIGLNIVKGILESHNAAYGVTSHRAATKEAATTESTETSISDNESETQKEHESGTTFWFEL